MRLGDLWAKHGGGTMRPDSAETKDLFIFGVTDDSRDVRYGYAHTPHALLLARCGLTSLRDRIDQGKASSIAWREREID